MATRNHYYETDPYVVAAINHKMSYFYNHHTFNEDTLDDLRQELFVHVFQYMHNFDPKRGKWSTFVEQMLKSAIANFMRAHKAESRRKENVVRFCEDVFDEQNDNSSTNVNGPFSGSRQSFEFQKSDNTFEDTEFQVDIELILATLPLLYQRICRLRLDGESISGTARALKMPRSSLYFFLEKIKEILFNKYFKSSNDFTVTFKFSPFK